MNSYFGPDFFTANRANLRAAVGPNTLIVITANGVMQRSGDEPAAFFQDSNFWYLTGLQGADLILVMDTADTYIIVPSLSVVREAFDGAHDIAAYADRSGITSFLPEKDGWQKLRTVLSSVTTVATLASPPVHMKAHGVYTLPFRRRLIARLRRSNPRLEIEDVRLKLAAMRVIKQPEELKALQRAIDITGDTLREVTAPTFLRQTTNEYELDAAISYGFRRRGAEGHAFAPIVGAGKHSTTLHHVENSGPIETDDMIVLDVGASVEHYAADITRTVSKQPMNDRQRAIFDAVVAVQDYALTLLRPGILLQEYERAVEVFMGRQLQKLHIITEPTHENVRTYFPHATSHFLGLDTHDVGDYRLPLQAGMVVTCEPGIYVAEERIGIRIEDDVLITETGNTVLSNACPRRI